jgi:hypothetical protein
MTRKQRMKHQKGIMTNGIGNIFDQFVIGIPTVLQHFYTMMSLEWCRYPDKTTYAQQ